MRPLLLRHSFEQIPPQLAELKVEKRGGRRSGSVFDHQLSHGHTEWYWGLRCAVAQSQGHSGYAQLMKGETHVVGRRSILLVIPVPAP